MTHGAVASELGNAEITRAVLADFRTAPVRPEVKATLAFLQKLTITPEHVTPDDARAVLAAGVAERELIRAIYICATLNVLNRLSDVLGFEIPSEATLAQRAKTSVDRLRREGRLDPTDV